MTSKPQDPFFKPIGDRVEETDKLPEDAAESGETTVDEEAPVQTIESLCMRCGEENSGADSWTESEQGSLYTAKILNRGDLNRQVVKSSYATIIIPEFELTIPAKRGQLTTVEGLVRDVIGDLSADQPLRRIQDEPTYEKIKALLKKLHDSLGDDEEGEPVTHGPDGEPLPDDAPLRKSFTVKVDDPAGNSWVEFLGSMADPKWSLKTYDRSREQDVVLGLVGLEDAEETEKVRAIGEEEAKKIEAGESVDEDGDENGEVYIFPGTCSSCHAPCDTKMKKVVIPYFKDILIMSTNCDRCGYRDNEIKSGSAISEQGKRITLKVEDTEDLARDILKSENCGLEIPEIQLVLQPGTLGGRFTTLEGLLTQVYDELSEKAFARGDAAEAKEERTTFEEFLGKLKQVMKAEIPFTVILDDPLANSYLQNIYAPDPDPNMTVELYDRTWDQNEELGLNDMKVEGYEEDAEEEKEA
ncbi:nucleolar zinc-finger protein [Tulasnella sp. 427]|nr:nucleolar zinc-finger protein [Tulasnella sp. 427]